MSFKIVFSHNRTILVGNKNISRPALSHRATGVPGNIHTGVVLLVNTTFLTLVTIFNVLLVVGTEIEWKP